MNSSVKNKAKPMMTRSTKKKQKVSETETLIREDLAEESDYSEEDLIVMDDIIVDDHLKKNKKNYERVTTKKNKVIDDLSVEEDEKLEIEEEPGQNLPCRENELKLIYEYIRKGLETKGAYSSLYISGMPGTGKTACVQSTIQKLKSESQSNRVPPFDTYYINAMKMTKNTR